MKVLHIINSLNFGGAEKLLADTLPRYKNEGIEISVLLLQNNKTPFYDALKKANVEILSFKTQTSIYNPWIIFKILPFFKKADIVHVHLFPALYWVALASVLTTKKIKLVLTEHNTENKRRNKIIFKYIEKYIYKKYIKIIAISEGTKINLQKHLGKDFQNIITINNGIDINRIKKANTYTPKDLNLPDNVKIIIQISSFTPQKDQNTLIKALHALPNHIHLLLVGDGPLKKASKELTHTLQLEDRVHFLGYRADIPELVKTAHISVLSSHYEGFGLAIVEGMAANNACVASNVSGLSEIIEDCGILFSPGNSSELSEILLKLDNDSVFLKKTATQCLKKANTYDIATMVNSHLELYKSLVA